jgi:hypothetical protein
MLVKNCANGARYVQMHYSVDPQKGQEWARVERAKVPAREWQREMEMDETIYAGEPVYADYRDKRHCPLQGHAPLPICRGATYVAGWDCGQTITPAFCLLQITPKPWQVAAILEVTSPGAEPMEKFAPRVMAELRKRLPGRWDEVEHWGDATVMARNGANGETAQQAAARHGVRIRPASNEWNGRYGAVTWLLMNDINETIPRFLVDGVMCPLLREGFQGAYKFDESSAGDAVGPTRVLKERPLKNTYSHVHDALQYAACRVRFVMKRNGLPV